MPDQVPLRYLAAKFGDLTLSLLNLVFAKNMSANGDGISQSFNWMRLADGDKLYLINVSPGARCCLLDTSPNFRQIRLQIALHTVKYTKSYASFLSFQR
jgi:hypothetical protein